MFAVLFRVLQLWWLLLITWVAYVCGFLRYLVFTRFGLLDVCVRCGWFGGWFGLDLLFGFGCVCVCFRLLVG